VQARLFKSLKLWSFYVDLEESIGTVETTKNVYDKILDLRIANAQVCRPHLVSRIAKQESLQIMVNYAQFLEENQYFEESFKVRTDTSELCHLFTTLCRSTSEAWSFSHSR
jgi:pre-mRNA-splicing factor SYF1